MSSMVVQILLQDAESHRKAFARGLRKSCADAERVEKLQPLTLLLIPEWRLM